MSSQKFYRAFSVLLLLSLLSACQQDNHYARLHGFTMGTSYQITLKIDPIKAASLQQKIDIKLIHINQLMSTYIDHSELSIINQSRSTDCQLLSNENQYVIQNAITISQQTNGKFDITIDPLISEWGFDKKTLSTRSPRKW